MNCMVCVFCVDGIHGTEKEMKIKNPFFRSGFGAVEERYEERVGHYEGPVEDHK